MVLNTFFQGKQNSDSDKNEFCFHKRLFLIKKYKKMNDEITPTEAIMQQKIKKKKSDV